MAPRAVAVIPARFGSTRLPGKALMDIDGVPMVVRVAQRASQVAELNEIVVATDHPEIKQVVEAAGFHAVMTSEHHPSGSDRIAEACDLLDYPDDTIVVNIQGDQPLVEAEAVSAMIKLMSDRPDLNMATVACPLTEDIDDPNRVKVVLAADSTALYFSRAAIPYNRDGSLETGYLRHLGLYCYRRDFVRLFTSLPPGRLEQAEKLEQLRALENGYSIGVVVVAQAPPEVDTPRDLELVRAMVTG